MARRCYSIVSHLIPSYLLFVHLIISVKAIDGPRAINSNRTIPAIFIFGDSMIDIGTNIYLPYGLITKADFPYNGIDFPGSIPTGRFSNGYNIGDQLAMQLGFKKSPPAFLYLVNHTSINFKKKVQRGVNFASAGAGILYQSGQELANNSIVPLPVQIQQFSTVVGNITEARGTSATAKVLAKALYIFCIGANDIFEVERTGIGGPKEQFMATLQSAYRNHLQDVFDMGARKFAILGVGPIGCCPNSRFYNYSFGGDGGCNVLLNDYASTFHNVTGDLLRKMSSQLPDMKYALGDVYGLTMHMLQHHSSYGLKEVKSGCCGGGAFNGIVPCFKAMHPELCKNRSEYLFWDNYHPTQAASQLLANALYVGDTAYVSPISFRQLAAAKVRILPALSKQDPMYN